ncbi:sigma-70 family RNA polymerase sigma factor [Ruminococcus sp. AF37-6AT]|jgi:RNA polymerase sigma factor (sigma-70 family)|nr:sigma-70 family RNA polymerase sigma factor [Ruminococcus sp. AM07-21]RHL43867.1 sigma-70 family RNA polymerase sigma factor [Ruminococcus sp. AF37-6AT]RHP54727.1 sigma-70 family RNA polymerase sigma factor [Ruminococcus sp. AF31-16BH]
MGKSSSNDELTIRNQFDRICKLALKGEAVDYYRHIAYRQEHEVLLSELSQKEQNRLFTVDEYKAENKCFQVLGYDIEVKDALLAEAIQSLSEKKRKVVLLSYFMDMSDAEIARVMNLVRSTVHEHRRRSLELMKEIMEEYQNEQEK